jgi:hypothetical protein
MPTAIIAGLPSDVERRVQAAQKNQPILPRAWTILWFRSKGHVPGLAPSQVNDVQRLAASQPGGAHILIFRSELTRDQTFVKAEIAPYFRVRWLDHKILKSIPHRFEDFFGAIKAVLTEEQVWEETVKPQDESSCLLLPSCSFNAKKSVSHLWEAASRAGIERIRLSAETCRKFKETHWLPDTRSRNSGRAWIDESNIIFEHRGQRHALAPFPRSWKFSYEVVAGFHYDAQSLNDRPFNLVAGDGIRHTAPALGHVNIDPHGVVLV